LADFSRQDLIAGPATANIAAERKASRVEPEILLGNVDFEGPSEVDDNLVDVADDKRTIGVKNERCNLTLRNVRQHHGHLQIV
jgi:hypothetical protein